jgi:hypothetical protein
MTNDADAIRHVLEQYCLNLDRNDMAAWGALLAEDATLSVYGRDVTGRQAIVDLISQAPGGVHISGNCEITVDGEEAEAFSNYLFVSEADYSIRTGWYEDRLSKSSGTWLLTSRRITFLTPDGPSSRPPKFTT